MPYKDPVRQKAAVREAKRRAARRKAEERSSRVVAEVGAGVGLPERPGHDELVRLLGVQARSGSVRAIELLLRMEDADGSSDVEQDPLDELARRRAIGA